jgi:hypothetical protein
MMKMPFDLPTLWAEEPELNDPADDLTLLRRIGALPPEQAHDAHDALPAWPAWAETCF